MMIAYDGSPKLLKIGNNKCENYTDSSPTVDEFMHNCVKTEAPAFGYIGCKSKELSPTLSANK